MSKGSPQPATHRTRTEVLFAAAAELAVVLRRGPKRSYRLVTWDLRTDTFHRGQWMSGIIRLGDLSPDGRLLAYWAAQYHVRKRVRNDIVAKPFDPVNSGATELAFRLRRQGRKVPKYIAAHANERKARRPISDTWTAVSRPPYFTALACWPSCGTWTGGAVFRSPRQLELFESADGLEPVANVPMPAWMEIASAGRSGAMQVSSFRSAASPEDEASSVRERVAASLLASGCRFVDWVSLRQAPHLLFGADGAIYRLRDWETVAPANFLHNAQTLVDLSQDRFTPVAPPAWALSWDAAVGPDQGP